MFNIRLKISRNIKEHIYFFCRVGAVIAEMHFTMVKLAL